MSRFPSGIRFEYDEAHPSNFTAGNWRKDFIVIHHWNDPSLKPQFGGVVSWFKNPSANVSIQYMVEAGRIAQMIPESAMAWHAGNSTANRHGIGIELNPRQYDGDYETAAQLVAEIWGRRGKLPLRKHREFFGTACPGTWDVGRIQRRAEQIYSGTTTAGTVIEGEVMSAEEFWDYNLRDRVSGNNIKAGNMLRNTSRDSRNTSGKVWNARNNQTDMQFGAHLRRGDLSTNQFTSRVSGNQISAATALLNAQEKATESRNLAREQRDTAQKQTQMIKALATTLDELLDGQGKILKAVEDAGETLAVEAASVDVTVLAAADEAEAIGNDDEAGSEVDDQEED